ncbi:hypothetical protein HOY80DRAFT_953680 [Tuber brumale]|nr:hypothetical protein HOY80DRAFT_953680 [Tuber brumale]
MHTIRYDNIMMVPAFFCWLVCVALHCTVLYCTFLSRAWSGERERKRKINRRVSPRDDDDYGWFFSFLLGIVIGICNGGGYGKLDYR